MPSCSPGARGAGFSAGSSFLSIAASERVECVEHQAAVATFEEAVGQLPTPRMHDLYAAFLHEQLDAALAEASSDGRQTTSAASSDGKAAKAARRRVAEAAHALLKLAARAADAGARLHAQNLPSSSSIWPRPSRPNAAGACTGQAALQTCCYAVGVALKPFISMPAAPLA